MTSTKQLADKFLETYPDICDIYGPQLLKNIHQMYISIYEDGILVETVLTNEKYGGDSGHSGGSYYTTHGALLRYRKWLYLNENGNASSTSNDICDQLPEYTPRLPEYEINQQNKKQKLTRVERFLKFFTCSCCSKDE